MLKWMFVPDLHGIKETRKLLNELDLLLVLSQSS